MNFYELISTDKVTVRQLVDEIKKQYVSYPINKSNGKVRWLDAPNQELKDIQKNLLQKVLYTFPVHPAATGFVTGMSVKDGAKAHFGNKVLLTLDISNFFNSIKTPHMYKLAHHILMRMEHMRCIDSLENKSSVLKDFVSLVIYKGHLPQGAPTSPTLANLYCRELDKKLDSIASTNKLIYTRYADDMTFSHAEKRFDIGLLIPNIAKVVESYDLKINYKKVHIMRPHRRMKVTGIVINDKLSIPKFKYKNFRAKLHNLVKAGKEITIEEYQQLRGYAEWVRSLNPKKGNIFIEEIGKLTPPLLFQS